MRLSLLSALCCALVAGHRSYQNKIPNGANVPGAPGLGHTRPSGGGPRNAFGEDFKAAGFSWTKALCDKDSDDDGASNGVELGDPNCLWTQGSTPEFTAGITHPGVPGAIKRAVESCANFTAPATGTVRTLKFAFPDTNVPAQKTTYLKFAFNTVDMFAAQHPGDAPTAETYGVRFSPLLTSEAVHHMILYQCDQEPSAYTAAPAEGAMPCSKMKYAWAVGAKDFCTPKGVGMKFPNRRADAWYALEIHYDNPAELSTLQDTSGVQVTMVETSMIASGFFMMGSSLPALSVPPNRGSYHVQTTCKLPGSSSGGSVTAFAYLMHAHGLGRKLWITQERDGQYLRDAGCEPLFDFDLQEIHAYEEPFSMKGEDVMTVNCIYDSTSRTSVTNGGDATEDEMCLGFILYYPEVPDAKSCLTRPKEVSVAVEDHKCGAGIYNGTDEAAIPTWLVLHAVGMMLAWLVCAPLGILASMAARPLLGAPTWFKAHRALMMAVVLIGVVAAFLAFANLTSHFDGAHKIIGVLVTVMLVIQPLNGFLRPHPDPGQPKTKARRAWEILHKSTGRIAFVLAAVNIFLAPPLFEMYGGSARSITISAAVLLTVAVLLAAGAGLKNRGAKQVAAQGDGILL